MLCSQKWQLTAHLQTEIIFNIKYIVIILQHIYIYFTFLIKMISWSYYYIVNHQITIGNYVKTKVYNFFHWNVNQQKCS